MGTDFSKVNADKAQQIISALKDGKINSKEAKDLKLTPEEAAALNEAFSSGEARIGDFVLVNKGKSKDGKKQYSQTKKAEPQIPQEEPGFFEKAFNKVKKDVSKYAKTFTNAWNNNNGVVDVTVGMLGATTKTATDIVKDTAHNVEKGVTEATGSETLGKVAKYAAGAGLVADAAEAVEQAGDWSAAKVRDAAKQYTGTNRQILEEFANILDNMNIADIALLFAGGGAAIKGFKALPKALELLKGISLGKVAVPAAGIAAAASMTSCSPEEVNVNQSVAVKITQDSSLADAIKALKEGQDVQTSILRAILEKQIKNGTTLEEIKNLTGGNALVLSQILTAMTENNTLLNDIKTEMGANTDAILSAIIDLKSSVDNIQKLIENLPTEIKNSLSGDLNAILNAINKGNVSLDQITANVEALAAKLDGILDQIKVNGKTQKEIKEILEKIQSGQMKDSEKLLAMINLLKSIDSVTNEINGKLDKIINKFENAFPDNKEIKAALEKIEKYLEQNNNKTDVTNSLLEKLLNKAQNGGLSEKDLQKILDAIAKNGDKIDTTNKLLENMSSQNEKLQKEILNYIAAVGFEMNGHLNKILEAVKNIKTGDGANIEALLEKILAKMDGNTNDIIKAISNIKVTGGAVDLSSVEAMLKELIEISKKNGDKLSSIDSRLDVLNVTTKAIEEELKKQGKANGERYEKLMALLSSMKDAIGKGGNNFDDTKLMKALELISGKLDDILAAIKDHDVKVTVDVTGKVKCECNCGKNHEGILGDLDDILG